MSQVTISTHSRNSSSQSPQMDDTNAPANVNANQGEMYKKALKAANYAANKMRQALEQNLINEGLLQASKMLSELRTTSLTPKNYYSLYLDIERKLQFVEDFFYSYLTKKNSPLTIAELYERVQYIGNIVPRLYLMITVGSLYIRLRERPAEELIHDLVEMCKGVQNPTRGLFLRLHMTHKLKDKLPDKNSIYGTDYESTIKYLLTNFKDTVNLFCRLKGDWRGEKRERERSQLKSLIGQNLEGLSHLESLTTEVYRTKVLPVLLETIIKYKDVMSQEYLMLCVVSAFPDDFHLATLETLLDACTKLQYDVDLKTILIHLMDRLRSYAKNFPQSIPTVIVTTTAAANGSAKSENGTTDDGSASTTTSFDIVTLFSNYMRKIEKQKIGATDLLDIENSLLGLSMTIHRNEVRYVNDIVDSLADSLPPVEKCLASSDIQEKLVSLLVETILSSFDTVLSLLEINRFVNLMNLLNFENRRYVANELVNAVLEQDTKFSHWDQVSKFFTLIDPLLKDQEDATSVEENTDAFVEEQNRVALLVYQCENDDTDVLFRIYASVRKAFGRGGERRIQYTLVPLVYAFLRLVEVVAATKPEGKKATPERILEYCTQTLQVLSKFAPSLTLKLYLSGALYADRCAETAYTMEMLSQAFLLYETLDSNQQQQFFNQILSTLCELRNLDQENFPTYTTKACQNAAKLLQKPQQCQAAAQCSTLFWPLKANPVLQDKEKALGRLQRSLKIVKECRKPQQLPLLVEILNVYLYHFEYDNDLITHKYINGLLDLIRENLEDARSDDFGKPEMDGKEVDLATIESFFTQTTEYIRAKKGERVDKYAPIEVVILPLCRSHHLSAYVDEILSIFGTHQNGGVYIDDFRSIIVLLLDQMGRTMYELVFELKLPKDLTPYQNHTQHRSIEALVDEAWIRDILMSLGEWIRVRLTPLLRMDLEKRDKTQQDSTEESHTKPSEPIFSGDWRIEIKLWDEVLKNTGKSQYYGNMLNGGRANMTVRNGNQKWIAVEERDEENSGGGESVMQEKPTGCTKTNSLPKVSNLAPPIGEIYSSTEKASRSISPNSPQLKTDVHDNQGLVLSPDLFEEDEGDEDEIMSSSSDSEDMTDLPVTTNSKVGNANANVSNLPPPTNPPTRNGIPNGVKIIVEPIRSRQDPNTKIRVQMYCRKYRR